MTVFGFLAARSYALQIILFNWYFCRGITENIRKLVGEIVSVSVADRARCPAVYLLEMQESEMSW
jgi:hypothetical protein